MAIVEGRVASIIHSSDSFVILVFDAVEPETKTIKVTGHLHGLVQVRPDVPLRLVGDWVVHPKYGRQFTFTRWSPWAETTYDVEKFLHECVEGFSDKSIASLVARTFGLSAFDVLTDDPDEIRKLSSQGSVLRLALDRCIVGWASCQSVNGLASIFRDFSLNQELVQTAFKEFGPNAVNIISQNPYRLVVIEGFSFSHADRIANRLKVPQDDVRRMEGAILWALRFEARNGHLCVRTGDIGKVLSTVLSAEILETFGDPSTIQSRLLKAIDSLSKAQAVVVDPSIGVYLPSLYKYERESASKLVDFMHSSPIDLDLDKFLDGYEKSQSIKLSEAQRDAVHKLVEHKVLILTGLPGTGKTLLTKAFVRMFREAGLSCMLMAPTGIAAKRLAFMVGSEAFTVHRALKYDGRLWGHNNLNKLTVDAVIIDEASMLDQELFYRALDALHSDTRLILIGDDAQLPSVGPGNVLRELIGCSCVPHVRLTRIFRQSERSEIIIASHKIQQGLSPLNFESNFSSEFQFVAVDDEEKIVELIVSMAEKLKGRDANFQVLSPKYEGIVGVNNLNERLRERLNPPGGQHEWKIKDLCVRVGDRLMVIQNNYPLNVYNGDMCKLVAVNRDDLAVRVHGIVDGGDSLVNIPKKDASKMLKLAYAITAHKSQGEEFGTIIMPIVKSQGWMLQRNLFYTAVTRARSKVWLLGDPMAVQRAIENDKVIQRNTVLSASILSNAARVGVIALHGRPTDERTEESTSEVVL